MQFILTDPDDLPLEALNYLQKAIDKAQKSDVKLSNILDEARKGEGSIFVIKSDKIVGALYVQVFSKVLNVVLLGGDNIKDWKDDYSAFIKKTLKEYNLSHLCIIGRNGWGKVFKELKPLGTIYIFENEGV